MMVIHFSILMYTIQCSLAAAYSPDKLQLRIFGGEASTIEMNPWQAQLFYDRWFICGATLLRLDDESFNRQSDLILTAAHCLNNSWIAVSCGRRSRSQQVTKIQDINVVLGSSRKNASHGQSFPGLACAVHPQYNKRGLHENDIAMILLDKPAQYSSAIGAVRLPLSNDPPTANYKCKVSGFGHTEKGFVYDLRQVILPYWNTADCLKIPLFTSHRSMFEKHRIFCAGDQKKMKDACRGDSGGPYVCRKDIIAESVRKYRLYGLVTIGNTNCGKFPGIFTNVAKYRSWISRAYDKLKLLYSSSPL